MPPQRISAAALLFVMLFYFAFSSSLAGIIAPSPALKRIVTVSFLLRITAVVDLEAAIE